MYTNHLTIPSYQITNKSNYINNITTRIIKCAPLITAFITIGTLFSLIQEVNTRYIPYDKTEITSTVTFTPDDVKIVPIWEAVWLYVAKSPKILSLERCTWSNFFCARSL